VGAYRVVRFFRIPQCLDNRITDGGKAVSSLRRPPLYSAEIIFNILENYSSGIIVEQIICIDHSVQVCSVAHSQHSENGFIKRLINKIRCSVF
jgi:hypothetical protein